MKILFVTFNGIEDAAFGGAKASRRNFELLGRLGETKCITIRKKSSLRSFCSVLQGFYPPADGGDLKAIKGELKKENYDAVFFDGSHFGKLVKAVKREGIPAIVFFHNCEYDYIEVRFGGQNSPKKRIYKSVIRRQEGLAARLADRTVTFTERDAGRIRELYNVTVTDVIPLSIADVYVPARNVDGEKDADAGYHVGRGNVRDAGDSADAGKNPRERSCLLFGPLGQANEEAFRWFVTNVSPQLPCKTVVAGKGFESYRGQWDSEKVEVVGTVDDIARLYAGVSCVAIPLFSGSGMKIKTAEALMFGKQIFGTDEAYAGYDTADEGIGTVCNSAEEFVREITAFLEKNPDDFSPAARKLYETKYSLQASSGKFAELIKNACYENAQLRS